MCMSMKAIVIFPVNLSFDIGHEYWVKWLNGQVHRKVACVHIRLEFVCACRELDTVKKEIKIGV